MMARKRDLTEIIDLLRAYARQELLGPLRGARRWLAMGLLGSLLLVIGSILLLLGALRALQTETGSVFSGNLSWLPYLIVIGLSVLALYGLLRLVHKRGLAPPSQTGPRRRGAAGSKPQGDPK